MRPHAQPCTHSQLFQAHTHGGGCQQVSQLVPAHRLLQRQARGSRLHAHAAGRCVHPQLRQGRMLPSGWDRRHPRCARASHPAPHRRSTVSTLLCSRHLCQLVGCCLGGRDPEPIKGQCRTHALGARCVIAWAAAAWTGAAAHGFAGSIQGSQGTALSAHAPHAGTEEHCWPVFPQGLATMVHIHVGVGCWQCGHGPSHGAAHPRCAQSSSRCRGRSGLADGRSTSLSCSGSRRGQPDRGWWALLNPRCNQGEYAAMQSGNLVSTGQGCMRATPREEGVV